jgi:hypothetical protein
MFEYRRLIEIDMPGTMSGGNLLLDGFPGALMFSTEFNLIVLLPSI